MKRILASVSLVAVATTAAAASTTPAALKTPVPKPAHTTPAPRRVAPADEYFGKLKMSILGIRNTIHDIGANIDIDPSRAPGLMNKADFAEDAIRDWEKRYPADTWLPKSVFALERVYAKIDSDDGRRRSMLAMIWLVHDFPESWYGKVGRRELAEHRVGHPIDAPASATPAATPEPNPSPSLVPATLNQPK